ncbi:MAG: thioredoxin fold domain-containing protein [Burkholderiales bacterium]
MRVATVAILACAAAAAGAQDGELPHAGDLATVAAQAREHRTPVMLAFTQASCRFCQIAKRDYLVPLHRNPAWRERVVIREVDLDRGTPLRDFGGQTVTPREFAHRYRVSRVPTVIVVDDKGAVLSSPVTGLLADDFYQLYLERAIEEGLYRLRGRNPGG